MKPSSGVIVPSGASQVTSSMLLALARARRRSGRPRSSRACTSPVSGTPRSAQLIVDRTRRRGRPRSARPRPRPGPGDRAALADAFAVALGVERVDAELDLPQPVRGPDHRRQRLLAHQVAQDRAGLVAAARRDVDALEVVAVARDSSGSCSGPPSRRGPGAVATARPVLEADDLADRPEPGEVRGREVEHRDPVAVHAAVDVDHDVAADGLRLHRGDPVGGLLSRPARRRAVWPTRGSRQRAGSACR